MWPAPGPECKLRDIGSEDPRTPLENEQQYAIEGVECLVEALILMM